MKKILVLFVLFSMQALYAQMPDVNRAKRYFDRTFYSEAIPMYEALAKDEQSLEIVQNLADSYYFTNDYANAEKWYRLLIKSFPNTDAIHDFRYMHTLKATGNYDDGITFSKSKLSDNVSLNAFEKSVHELENIAAIGDRFVIKNLSVNTKNSEFGAISFNGNLIYSGIKSKETTGKNYKWNDEKYLDLLSIPLTKVTVGDSVSVSFSEELNTLMHEGNAVFTKDGNTVYFTRNNFKDGKRAKNKQKVSNLQIYKAEKIDGLWNNIVSLPFNNDNYSTEHPALSDDEKTLYFASDMPGTLGSFDIFSVTIIDATYGVPTNLGSLINTIYKEQFPFVAKEDKLYFSSDGHLGFGALDVFVSEIKDGVFSRPLNVGFPVNSGFDDFAFNIDSDTKKGYFSSNRTGGKGGDDIYELQETKDLIVEDCIQFTEGIITDVDTKLPLENALVILEDDSKKELQRVITTADGSFRLTVICESRFTIRASKEKYSNDFKTIKTNKERRKVNDASMALKSDEWAKKEAQLLAEQQKKQADQLAEQKRKDAEVALKKKKEIAEAQKKQRVADLLAKEKDVVKDKDRLLIKTEPIYFDYDLWYIRKESKVILNRVIELMKRYPDMVVEIGSHTDVRGNNAYNLELSSKRAASTRTYFIENGIPVDRIFSKGYGETVPIIRCVPDDSCSEEQHELNRRSEFVIKNL